ncbi:MAG: hypothetical protein LBH19_12065 [Dysgonamonadaceae bacterium]|jgi:hypothetical protein|nr:hypothetical protein [Dysgonamonadaceae bacterium]
MNRKYYIPVILLTAMSIVFSGCYVNKPAGVTTKPDYNKRVSVSGAHTVKRGNALDVTFNIGLIGVGAYAGYNTPLIQQQTANGREPVRVANAAIGALAGAGVGYLIDQIAGKNKRNYNIDPNKWIRKANPEYKLLGVSGNSFTLIHPSAEQNFSVRNIQDVRDFQKMFPNSAYAENVVSSGIKNLTYSELPELLSTYPASPQAPQIRERYLALASTIEECIDAAKRYPTLTEQAETKALAMVKDVSSAKTFSSYFSKEKNENALFQQCVAAKISSNEDIVATFPTHPEANTLRAQILSRINLAKDICDFMQKYPNFNKQSICQRLSTNKILKTTDDFKTVNKCLNEQGDMFIVSALKNSDVPAYKYAEIIYVYTLLDNSTMQQIFAMYTSAKRQEFSQCVSAKSASRMKSFIDNYAMSSPDDSTNDLNMQAKSLYEYYSAIDGSIYIKANYAKAHPDTYVEMENLAYKMTSPSSPGDCENYLKYFPNGAHTAEVKSDYQKAMNTLCFTCHGNGNCSRCNGNQTIQCTTCGGKGWYETTEGGFFGIGGDPVIKNCYTCNGSGRMKCPGCGGSGRCNHCHGSRYQYR